MKKHFIFTLISIALFASCNQHKKPVLSPREALDLVNQMQDNCYEPLEEAVVGDDVVSAGVQYSSRHNASFKLRCDNEAELYSDGRYYYSVQQYEHVVDDPETGEWHTATSNWFLVDAVTGKIIPQFENDNYEENERWVELSLVR